MTETETRHWTMDDIQTANKNAGFHFFDAATMTCFHSRLGAVYQGTGGVFFVTSERYDRHTPRLFNVRQFNPDTGAVRSVSKYRMVSKTTAHNGAFRLAQGE